MKVIVKDGVLPLALISTTDASIDPQPLLDGLEGFVKYASAGRDFDSVFEVAVDMQAWMNETYKLYPENFRIQTTLGGIVEELDDTACIYSYEDICKLDQSTLIDIQEIRELQRRAIALRKMIEEQSSQVSKES